MLDSGSTSTDCHSYHDNVMYIPPPTPPHPQNGKLYIIGVNNVFFHLFIA